MIWLALLALSVLAARWLSVFGVILTIALAVAIWLGLRFFAHIDLGTLNVIGWICLFQIVYVFSALMIYSRRGVQTALAWLAEITG